MSIRQTPSRCKEIRVAEFNWNIEKTWKNHISKTFALTDLSQLVMIQMTYSFTEDWRGNISCRHLFPRHKGPFISREVARAKTAGIRFVCTFTKWVIRLRGSPVYLCESSLITAERRKERNDEKGTGSYIYGGIGLSVCLGRF
jgi:hypothetical protein